MKIILAQGNPGSQYTATRHNVGWMIVDAFATSQGVSFSPQSKFFASIAEFSLEGEKILLVKPTTFYNETGRTARALLDFYKLNSTDIFVIHDDLSLPFGTLRVREKGSAAGNNGIKSLTAHLGEEYWRLRVGIWSELREHQHDADFVLSRFSKEETEYIQQGIAPAVQSFIEQFHKGTLTATSANTIATLTRKDS